MRSLVEGMYHAKQSKCCRRNVSRKAIEVYRKANLDGLNPTICTAMNEAKKEEERNGSW